MRIRGISTILFGEHEILLDAVEQLVNSCQTRAVADALLYARAKHIDGRRSLSRVIDFVMRDVDERGLDVLGRGPRGDYALFRRFELAAALNRLRTLKVA